MDIVVVDTVISKLEFVLLIYYTHTFGYDLASLFMMSETERRICVCFAKCIRNGCVLACRRACLRFIGDPDVGARPMSMSAYRHRPSRRPQMSSATSITRKFVRRSVKDLPTGLANRIYKSSAVAEIGDRGHNRHGPKRGLLCPFRSI